MTRPVYRGTDKTKWIYLKNGLLVAIWTPMECYRRFNKVWEQALGDVNALQALVDLHSFVANGCQRPTADEQDNMVQYNLWPLDMDQINVFQQALQRTENNDGFVWKDPIRGDHG